MIIEPFQDLVIQPETLRPKMATAYQRAQEALQEGYAVEVSVKPKKSTRSIQANSCMWAHLADLANQVCWHGNKLDAEEWKEVISAGLKAQKVVPGIEGGFVVIGARTSKMSIKEMGALIELILAFGAQQGVRFTAPRWVYDRASALCQGKARDEFLRNCC